MIFIRHQDGCCSQRLLRYVIAVELLLADFYIKKIDTLMKILLCILLLGYMIFGPMPNQKNRPSAGKLVNGEPASQNRIENQQMISRVVFLDAKGNILDGSSDVIAK